MWLSLVISCGSWCLDVPIGLLLLRWLNIHKKEEMQCTTVWAKRTRHPICSASCSSLLSTSNEHQHSAPPSLRLCAHPQPPVLWRSPLRVIDHLPLTAFAPLPSWLLSDASLSGLLRLLSPCSCPPPLLKWGLVGVLSPGQSTQPGLPYCILLRVSLLPARTASARSPARGYPATVLTWTVPSLTPNALLSKPLSFFQTGQVLC